MQVVPSGGRDPGILGLVGLSTNITDGIGDSESAHSTHVDEERVIHRARNKSVPKVLRNGGGFREGNGVRSAEEQNIISLSDWFAANYQQRMKRPPTFEPSDGEVRGAISDAFSFKPVKGAARLLVTVGRIAFKTIKETIAFEAVTVELGMKGQSGEIRFRRHNDGGV